MKKKYRSLLCLATVAVTTIHVINRIEYSKATIKDTLNTAENLFYEWRFGKVRYTKRGNGSPVLLLHDLSVGSSSYEFHKIVGELSKKHEVYCIDLLGFGLSDKPQITFTNYLYVQLISDFIKNIIGKRTDLIAVGEAFPIAALICHNDQELVRNIIGINPQSLYQLNQIPSKQTKILKLLIETPVIGTFAFNMLTSGFSFRRHFEKTVFYDREKIEETDITAYVEASHTKDYCSKYAQASLLGRYMNVNIIHALKKIDNSIYLLGGEEKPEIQNILDNYVYYNNAIETSYIPKTKQLPHLEDPEAVLTYLDMYL